MLSRFSALLNRVLQLPNLLPPACGVVSGWQLAGIAPGSTSDSCETRFGGAEKQNGTGVPQLSNVRQWRAEGLQTYEKRYPPASGHAKPTPTPSTSAIYSTTAADYVNLIRGAY